MESGSTFSFSPIPQLSQYHRPNPWAQFCCKIWGDTAWCETNIIIGSMQKWRFKYRGSQSYF